MKKIFNVLFLILTVVAFFGFIYSFCIKLDLKLAGLTAFETIFFGIFYIMTENRPTKTDAQKRHNERVMNQGLTSLILATIALVMVVMMSSCKTSGYGCKGKESWKHMERRINRPY